MAATALGDYQLYCFQESPEGGQFVFETKIEAFPKLSRVKSVEDLLDFVEVYDKELFSKLLVAFVALFGGHFIARRELKAFLGAVLLFLLLGVYAAKTLTAAALLLSAYFVQTLLSEGVSVEWFVTVFSVVFTAVLAVMCIRMASKQDSRSYVLLRDSEEASGELRGALSENEAKAKANASASLSDEMLSIRNALPFDVKVLCFDRSDRVFFIPKGGLLPAKAVIRAGRTGHFPGAPLTAKIFAPFETEPTASDL